MQEEGAFHCCLSRLNKSSRISRASCQARNDAQSCFSFARWMIHTTPWTEATEATQLRLTREISPRRWPLPPPPPLSPPSSSRSRVFSTSLRTTPLGSYARSKKGKSTTTRLARGLSRSRPSLDLEPHACVRATRMRLPVATRFSSVFLALVTVLHLQTVSHRSCRLYFNPGFDLRRVSFHTDKLRNRA